VDLEPELLGDEPVRLAAPQPPPDDETTDRRALRRRHAGWSVVALVLVVIVAAGYADSRERSREATAVRACETQLRRASDHADYRLGLTTGYVRPIVGAGSSAIHLADLMAPRARRVLPAAQLADRTCKAVSLRPWHFSLVDRQHAATAYSGALVTLLQTIAAQGNGPFHGDRTLQRLREAAGLDGG
jgi:hypothetical protein